MNILVIGNGFDLAHDLPTSYSDVLNFLQAINITSKWRGEKNEFINTHLSNKNFNSYVSDYIINAFDSRTKKGNSAFKNSNPIIQELYDNLDNNIWYTYLWDIYSMGKMKGINWIDFEGEISHIIERIDKEEENIYLPFRKITSEKDEKINIFFSRLPLPGLNTTPLYSLLPIPILSSHGHKYLRLFGIWIAIAAIRALST